MAERETKRETTVYNGEVLELVDESELPVCDPGSEGIRELTDEDWLLIRFGLTDDVEVNGVKLKAP